MSAAASVVALVAAPSVAGAESVGVAAAAPVPAPVAATALPARPATSGAGSEAAPDKAATSAPASFVPNVGQADAGVAFVAAGGAVSLGPSGLAWSVAHTPGAPAGGGRSSRGAGSPPTQKLPAAAGLLPAKSSPPIPASPPTALAMHVVGADASAPSFTADPQPGKVNYLLGNDPSKWHTDLATFATVGWHDVYPGVDVAYHAGKGQVEYTFTLAPGADPAAVRLAFGPDVSKTALQADGSLALTTPAGVVRQAAPQLSQGAGAATSPVAGGFQLLPGGQVGFAVGAYDRSRPLVIDPTIAYSTFLGDTAPASGPFGSSGDTGTAIAVDPTGAAYATGTTVDVNFPTTAGAFQKSISSGGTDGFVTKLNPAGTAYVYSTYFGGLSCCTTPSGIAVDAAGHAYLTGTTCAPDFPTTASAYKRTEPNLCSAGAEVWASELNAAGSALVFSTLVGPVGFGAPAMALRGGNVFLSGGFAADSFPTTPGAFQTTAPSGTFGGYVTKLDPTGSHLVYSTLLAPPDGGALTKSIAVDALGAAYVTGYTNSANFPTTAGVVQPSDPGGCCTRPFVTKFNPAGSALAYSTYLTAPPGGGVAPGPIAVDSSGDAWVAGSTSLSTYPTTPGARQTSPGGGQDVVVSKLNPTASKLLYSTYLGGSRDEQPNAMAVDRFGNAYLGGNTGSVDFPTLNAPQAQNGYQQAAAFSQLADGFVAKFAPSGTLLYSTYLGGMFGDGVMGLAVDGSEDAYLTGGTGSQDFPVSVGAPQTSINNQATFSGVAFMTKLAAFGVALSAPKWSGVGQPVVYTATVRNDGTQHDATGVTVTDTLPPGLSLVSASASKGSCATSGQTATCQLGTVARGQAATVTLTATATATGTLTNVATVTSSLGTASGGATTVVGPAGCGSTITASVTLSADIGPCPGPGVTIGADNVTLDLGGHKIFGTGNHTTAEPYPDSDLAGVHMDTHHGGAVRNGEITGFNAGVWLQHSTGVTMTGLDVHDNVGLDDNFAAVLGDGIALFHSGHNVIEHSTIVRNGIFAGISVVGLDSDHNLIAHNVIDDNLQLTAGSDGQGIDLNPFLEVTDPRRGQSLVGNDIIGNEIKGNQSSGISSRSNTESTYAGNDVEGNGVFDHGFTFPNNGIGVSNDQNATPITNVTIKNNIVAGNGHDGIQVSTEGNHILNNVSVNNNQLGPETFRGPGFDLHDMFTDPNTGAPGCDSNVWSANIWSAAVGFSPDCTSAGGQAAVAPAFTSADHTTFPIGAASSFTLAGSGVPAPTFRLTAGRLPTGVSFNPFTGVLSGTPAAGTLGAYPLTFTAHNPLGPNAVQHFTLTVGQAATGLVLVASPSPATFASPVTFTATVVPTPANTLAPTGTVRFYFYGSTTPAATVAVSGGKASFTTAGLGSGNQSVTATYSGDANFTGSSATTSLAVTTSRTLTGAVTGGVVVAPGTTVLLRGATVNGSVTVQPGGALDVESSTINGSLLADQPAALRLCATTTAGSVTVAGAGGFVLVADAGDDACGANNIGGSLNLLNNTAGVEAIGNQLGGALTQSGNSGAGPFPEDTAPEITGTT
ncbi:MAG TPA: SBBP repeat-containing protein [Acidimicrobiales bacterium]|nr:SBBP repeat-containing protein [Acidimicrobiales bacterium]